LENGGENGDLIEEAFKSGYRRRKDHDDRVRGRRMHNNLPSPERKESPVGECNCGSINAFTV